MGAVVALGTGAADSVLPLPLGATDSVLPLPEPPCWWLLPVGAEVAPLFWEMLAAVLRNELRSTHHGDGLGGSHGDGGRVAGLAAAASSLAGRRVDEGGSHGGSGVAGDGGLALGAVTGTLLLATIGGWGLSLSNC